MWSLPSGHKGDTDRCVQLASTKCLGTTILTDRTWTSVHLVTMLTLVYVPRDCMFQLDSGHWQSRTAWLSSQKILCWHIADEDQQEFEWEGLGSIVIWEDKVVPKTKQVQKRGVMKGQSFRKGKNVRKTRSRRSQRVHIRSDVDSRVSKLRQKLLPDTSSYHVTAHTQCAIV